MTGLVNGTAYAFRIRMVGAGGPGATARMMQVLARDGAPVEWEMTLDVTEVSIDSARVTVKLGFDPLLGRPAVLPRYDPRTAPELF